MKDYIEREAAIKVVEKYFKNTLGLNPDICVDGIKSISAADVVPWAWLESYADGKRTNYCSGWVLEAKYAYSEEESQ